MRPSSAKDTGPVGSFEEQVLLAVIRTQPEAYGMGVRRELATVTGREVTIGSVYITLDRLEAKGLVASARGRAAEDSASRRLFSVTAAGVRALTETRSVRDRLWAGVDLARLRNA